KLSSRAPAPSAARALASAFDRLAARNSDTRSVDLIELGSGAGEPPPPDELEPPLDELELPPDGVNVKPPALAGRLWMLWETASETATAPTTAPTHTTSAITRRMRTAS